MELKSTIKCPVCGHKKEETMPADARNQIQKIRGFKWDTPKSG